jgi:hypothetical protein
MTKRRQILTALGTEHILKDRVIQIQTEKPLLILQEVVSESHRLLDSVEPPKDVGNKGQIKQIYAKSSSMWRWAESNRRANEFLSMFLQSLVRLIPPKSGFRQNKCERTKPCSA